MEIHGIVKNIIFENRQNQFKVINVETEDGEIVCTGELPEIHPGEMVEITGEMVYHDRFGDQIQVENLKKAGFHSRIAMIRYMEAVLPHVGATTAKKIVDEFGEETMKVLENSPDLLLRIPGIGKKKLEDIKKVLLEEREQTKIYLELQKLGISMRQAKKIIEFYGHDKTLETISENPYQLIEDIPGIGFRIADSIAMRQRLDQDSFFRIKAAFSFYLDQEAHKNGHCCVLKKRSLEEISILLNLSPEILEDHLQELLIDRTVVEDEKDGEAVFYHPDFLEVEEASAHHLGKICKTSSNFFIHLEERMEEIEEETPYTLGEEQLEAVRKAFEEKVLIITGGPGTGKTTIIQHIVNAYNKEGLKITLAAPTGRAAKRMEESCEHKAQTIHRLLGYKPVGDDQMVFERDFYDPLETDCIIIDEASMIDIFLLRSLLDAVSDETRMIFVGDVDQLPSVGPGNVLKDMISSEVIPTIFLETVYRQAKDSNIVINAHRMNRGEFPILNEKGQDFFFIDAPHGEGTKKELIRLVSERLPNYYKNLKQSDFQVLTPLRRTDIGTEVLNESLQEALNPKTPDKEEIIFREKIFREKDFVMQIRNDYEKEFRLLAGGKDKGVYNGDLGVIQTVDPIDDELEILFDETREGKYRKEDLQDIELSYAITIHKSQGSEFPAVIIPINRGPYLLLTRNLIYTAVTRAKELVVLVGDREALKNMIDNNYVENRYTKLKERIREYVSYFGGEE